MQVLGAHRAGMRTVILPWANKKDVEHDINHEIQQQIHIIFVHSIEDVIEAAFGKGKLLHRLPSTVLYESRL
jgi:ATP-dependent Lon protease